MFSSITRNVLMKTTIDIEKTQEFLDSLHLIETQMYICKYFKLSFFITFNVGTSFSYWNTSNLYVFEVDKKKAQLINKSKLVFLVL